MGNRIRYSQEADESSARTAFDPRVQPALQWKAIRSIAEKIG